MTADNQLFAAVAAGRFRANESAILAEALEQSEPWTVAALLRRTPERDQSTFYRAVARLRKRKILLYDGKRHEINPDLSEWMKPAGVEKLFGPDTPETLGFLRRTAEGAAPKKSPSKPKKRARAKPAVLDTDPRPGVDANGDQPGQRHITAPNGSVINEKEPDIWERTAARLKAANRRG